MYHITKSTFRQYGKEYTGYGIGYIGSEHRGNYIIEVIAPDISCDMELVSSIAEKCNKYGVSPIHAADIIYDSIE